MKNKLRISLLTVVLAVLLMPVTASAQTSSKNDATGYAVIVDDQADLLSDSEEEELLALMYGLTEDCNGAFVTIDANAYSTQAYADNYAELNFGYNNNVVFVVDMDNRYLYLSAGGQTQHVITDSKADTITDNVYRYASNKDYYTCGVQVFTQVIKVLSGERIAQPMKYASNAMLAILAAMLLNFAIVSRASKLKGVERDELIASAYSRVYNSDISVNHTKDDKRYSPVSSGSSSGGGGRSGGGGHHSSGGHSGGGHSGGGHRF